MVYLLLALGVGLSLLLTEFSIGLERQHSRLVGIGVFVGYCLALDVGSASHVDKVFGVLYWPHPQALAVITYWLIASIGAAINTLSKDH